MSVTESVETVPGSGIRLSIDERIATVLIDRGNVGNTLTSAAFHGLAEAYRQAEDDSTIAGIVLRSSSDVFCSGGDYVDPNDPTGQPSPHYAPYLTDCYDRWTTRAVPAIAVVDGAARAFGCAMALTADIVITTPNATFQLPEMLGGVVPSFAIAALSIQHPASVIAQLALGGRPMSAEQAFRQGLTSYLAKTIEVADTVLASYLQQWRSVAPGALRSARTTVTAMTSASSEERRTSAINGVQAQLDRFRDGTADQTYLRTS